MPLGVALCMIAYFMPLGSVPYRIDGSGVTSVSLMPQPLTRPRQALAASAGALPATMAMAMAALLTREKSDLNDHEKLPAPGLIRAGTLGIEPASATRSFDKQLILLGKLPFSD